MTPAEFDKQGAWAAIDQEKRRERTLRRVSIAAWTVTFLAVLGYGVLVGLQLFHMVRLVGAGAVTALMAVAAVTPFLITVGVVSLLIAAVSTIGVFLRNRTASLHEIQLRLASLEEMVSRQDS